jgi:hypothetical protein
MQSGEVQRRDHRLGGMTLTWRTSAIVPLLLVSLVLSGCDNGDGATSAPDVPPVDVGDPADYDPHVDPADFVTAIDNPYLPFTRGSRWVYESETEAGHERIEVEVTDDDRTVMGIDVTVVRDTVTLDGQVTEDTRDWYAQDRDGNVWYFGEDTKEYDEDGSVRTEGSWEAGVDGALPGISMYADPQVGQAYRQEFYEGQAEDVAKVVRTGAAVEVPTGRYEDVLVILEWNPLEPDVLEEKYYAPGVGPVLEQKVSGDDERVELIEHTPAP